MVDPIRKGVFTIISCDLHNQELDVDSTGLLQSVDKKKPRLVKKLIAKGKKQKDLSKKENKIADVVARIVNEVFEHVREPQNTKHFSAIVTKEQAQKLKVKVTLLKDKLPNANRNTLDLALKQIQEVCNHLSRE